MRNILLSSAAVFAFAGAAAAQVTINGDAELGFNDEIEGGVYFGVGLSVKLSTELDYGWTAAGKLDVDLRDDDAGSGSNAFDLGTVSISDWELSIASDMGGLYFGDTALASDKYWSGVTNMNDDAFAENGDGPEDAVLRAEYVSDSFEIAASVMVLDTGSGPGGSSGYTNGATLGFKGDLGGVTLRGAYQDEDVDHGQIWGLSVGGMLAGFDWMVAYSDEAGANTSTGVSASYPIGSVTVGGFYVVEDVEADNYGATIKYSEGPLSIDAFVHAGGDEDMGINIAVDADGGSAAGWALFAGWSEDDGSYVGATRDLMGGTLKISYGDDSNDAANDEIGPEEYLTGFDLNFSVTF